jgi:Uma2 family endonuclease
MTIRGEQRFGARKRLFDVHEYHRMGEIGILHEDDHVELIEGELYNSKTGEKRLFDVHEYHRMIEAGIIREGSRVQLIEGEVLEKAAMGSRHAACVNRLFNRCVGENVIVSVQCPIRLGESSEPEADIALLKPRDDFYANGHPTPEDVPLLVEVSDTSLRHDRETKLSLYARAGISEVWIVNLPEETIEIHPRPATGKYRETVRAKRGEKATSRTVPGFELAVEDILG